MIHISIVVSCDESEGAESDGTAVNRSLMTGSCRHAGTAHAKPRRQSRTEIVDGRNAPGKIARVSASYPDDDWRFRGRSDEADSGIKRRFFWNLLQVFSMSTTNKTANIIFVEHDGTEHTVEAKIGVSIMQAAVNNLVPGIEADCGGLCACATCHGYIDPAWLDKVPAKTRVEAELLENAPSLKPESRLTCQINVTDELHGIVIRLPESQY